MREIQRLFGVSRPTLIAWVKKSPKPPRIERRPGARAAGG